METFKKQVLPTKDKLYRFALKFVSDSDEAKDIVQEVFIKVWDRRDEMLQLDSIEAWCMRVTRNLSLDKLNSKRRKLTDSLVDRHSNAVAENSTPLQTLESEDTMINIKRFIDELPEKQRQVMQLRDIEGFSYKEIEEILSIDMNQVKVNLFRARKAVRENFLNVNAYGT